jgi:hypothetical protein
MNKNELSIKARKIISKLARSEIGAYVDTTLAPPDPFRGSGKIKLIVLGQDFLFPHLPGLRHKFYRQQIDGYLAFMKKFINL